MRDGSWRAIRLPDDLYQYYSKTESSRIRANCTAGVRLRFKTDALYIKAALRYGAAARPIYKSSVLVDGEEYSTPGPNEPCEAWEGVLFEQASPSVRVIDWWLSNLCSTSIRALEMSDGVFIQGASGIFSCVWRAYGDSITQGMTSSAPHLNYVAHCAQDLNAMVSNFGVGGAKLDQGLVESVPKQFSTIISIAYGTNDFANDIPIYRFGEFAHSFIAALKLADEQVKSVLPEVPRCSIILITPLPWVGSGKNPSGKTLEDYRVALRNISRRFDGVTLVEGEELVPDDAQYFVDNVHPNDEGFALYAQNLLPHMKRALAVY